VCIPWQKLSLLASQFWLSADMPQYCTGGSLGPTPSMCSHYRESKSIAWSLCRLIYSGYFIYYVDELYLSRCIRESARSRDRNSLSQALFLFLFRGRRYLGTEESHCFISGAKCTVKKYLERVTAYQKREMLGNCVTHQLS
jgi:hypothetical protein